MLCKINGLEGNIDKVLRFIQARMSSTADQKGGTYIDGNSSYQLARLEKIGKTTSAKKGLYKFYFPSGVFQDNEKDILQVLSQETAREILMFIIERKNPTQLDIVGKIGISAASANWHVKRLIV